MRTKMAWMVVALVAMVVTVVSSLRQLNAEDATRTPLILRTAGGDLDPDLRYGTYAQGAKADSAYADTNTAASANTASKLVKRDSSGNFAAGTITANLTGDASGSAGSCTGNAATATLSATVTVADGTDTSSYVAIFDSATGSLAAKTDGALLYNAGTGALTATTISCSPTISTGTAAPTTTPGKIGDIFIDTSAHKLYFADTATDSAGWVIAN